MKTRRNLRLASVTAGVLGILLAAAPSLVLPAFGAEPTTVAEKGAPVARNIQLGVGKSMIVDLPADALEVYVGEPKVANAIVRSSRRIYISALSNGQTSIFALGKDGRQIAALQVTVGRDVAVLKELFRTAIPGNDIQVNTVADRIVLTGSVASAGEAQKAIDIASGFLDTADSSNGGAGTTINVGKGTNGSDARGSVINSMIIRGLDQVSLRVTISEVHRDIIKQLGISTSGTSPNGNNFQNINPFAINGTIGNTAANVGWALAGGRSLSATLQAFEREGVARTLAEPTVTAVSGESAKFLAGGTIPIPSSENCNNNNVCIIGYVQQPYGVTLNFTPVVLSQGRIQLHIATEVTDIDESKQITLLNISVPGFRTRKNETTVELPSGGSIVSAGLISTQTQQAINGVPGLMNLPVLGTLFRSRDFTRNETELLIIVTPYIVHAVDPHDVVKPDANFAEASDPQAWFLGRMNRIYSTAGNLQRPPSYVGHVGFIND